MQKAVIVYLPVALFDNTFVENVRAVTKLFEAGCGIPAGISGLNELLEQGWKVVSCTPMGGGGNGSAFASIVVLEK